MERKDGEGDEGGNKGDKRVKGRNETDERGVEERDRRYKKRSERNKGEGGELKEGERK